MMATWFRGAAFAAVVGLAIGGGVGGAAAQATSPDAAKKFINDMGNRAVATLAKVGDLGMRNQEFTRLMLDALDFDALANYTLGKMARTVTPENKKEFTRLFAAHVIDVAIEKFGNIQVNAFAIGGTRSEPNGDIKVNTVIDRAGDKPLNVDWRVRSSDGATKINDLEVEGYSLATHYRGEFERAGVSTVTGLIGKLKDMTKDSVSLAAVQQAMK